MSTHASRAFTKLLSIFSKCGSPKWDFMFDTRMFDVGIFASAVDPITKTLILNIGPNATRDLTIEDEAFSFKTKRGGFEVSMYIPFASIISFSHPNGAPYLWPWFGVDTNTPREEFDFKDQAWGTTLDGSGFDAFFKLVEEPKVIKLPFPSKDNVTTPEMRYEWLIKNLFPMGPQETLSPFHLVSEATIDSESTTTSKSKAEALGIRVIEGGKSKMESDPVLVDIHEARKAKRIQALNEIKAESTASPFPKFDITKCFVSRRKVKRPSWLQVIDGGKSIASMDAISLGKFS